MDMNNNDTQQQEQMHCDDVMRSIFAHDNYHDERYPCSSRSDGFAVDLDAIDFTTLYRSSDLFVKAKREINAQLESGFQEEYFGVNFGTFDMVELAYPTREVARTTGPIKQTTFLWSHFENFGQSHGGHFSLNDAFDENVDETMASYSAADFENFGTVLLIAHNAMQFESPILTDDQWFTMREAAKCFRDDAYALELPIDRSMFYSALCDWCLSQAPFMGPIGNQMLVHIYFMALSCCHLRWVEYPRDRWSRAEVYDLTRPCMKKQRKKLRTLYRAARYQEVFTKFYVDEETQEKIFYAESVRLYSCAFERLNARHYYMSPENDPRDWGTESHRDGYNPVFTRSSNNYYSLFPRDQVTTMRDAISGSSAKYIIVQDRGFKSRPGALSHHSMQSARSSIDGPEMVNMLRTRKVQIDHDNSCSNRDNLELQSGSWWGTPSVTHNVVLGEKVEGFIDNIEGTMATIRASVFELGDKVMNNTQVQEIMRMISDLTAKANQVDSMRNSAVEIGKIMLGVSIFGIALFLISKIEDDVMRKVGYILIGVVPLAMGLTYSGHSLVQSVKSYFTKVQPQFGVADDMSMLLCSILHAKFLGDMPKDKKLGEFMKNVGQLNRQAQGISKVLEWVYSVFERFVEWLELKFNRDFQLFTSGSTQIDAFLAEAKAFNDSEPSVEELVRLSTLIKQGELLVRTYHSKPKFTGKIKVYLDQLKDYEHHFKESLKKGVDIRMEPLAFCMSGAPGVGKTTVIQLMTKEVLAECFGRTKDRYRLNILRDNPNAVIYTRDTSNTFWDAYAGQFAVVWDDFLQLKDGVGVASECLEIIRAVNVQAFPLHMADLTDKGSTFFTSKFVLCSTNAKSIKTDSINSRSAVERRFDAWVYVVPKAEYSTDPREMNIHKRRLDMSKVGGGINKDIYEFHIAKCDETQKDDQGYYLPSGIVYNWNEMKESLINSFEKKHDNETRMKDCIEASMGETFERIAREYQLEGDGPSSPKFHDGIPSDYNFVDHFDAEEFLDGKQPDEIDKWAEDMVSLSEFLRRSIYPTLKGTPVDGRQYWHCGTHTVYHEFFKSDEKTFGEGENFTRQQGNNRMRFKIHMENYTNGDVFKEIQTVGMLVYCVHKAEEARKKKLAMRSTYEKMVSGITSMMNAIKQFFMKYGALRLLLGSAAIISGIIMAVKLGYMAISSFGGDNQEKKETENQPVLEASSEPRGRGKGIVIQDSSAPRGRARPVAIQAEDRIMDFTIEANGKDHYGTSVAINVASQNQYAMFYNHRQGGRRKMGFATFVRNQVYMIPRHFVTVLKNLKASGNVLGHDDVEFIGILNNNMKFTQSVDDVIDCHYTPAMEKQDFCVVQAKGVRLHADITPLFVSATEMDSVLNRTMLLDVPASVKGGNLITTYISRGKKGTEVIPSEYGDVRVHTSLTYGSQTDKGDCGSLIRISRGARDESRFVGFHVAGDREKVGIGACLTREEIVENVNLIDHNKVGDKHLSVQMNIFDEVVQVPYEGNFVPGFVSDEKVTCSGDTKIRESVLHGAWGDSNYIPAFLRPFKRDGELVDPIAIGLKQYGGYTKTLSEPILEACANHYLNALLNATSGCDRRGVIDYETAVRGDPERDFLQGIPRKTSAGYPYSCRGHKGKKKFFGFGDVYEFGNVDEVALRREVYHIIEMAKRGVRLFHVFQDFPKDERRKTSKALAGKTRMISGSPLAYLIACRMYFLDFTVAMMDHRVNTEMCVGMNVYDHDWDQLAKRLKSMSNNIIAGDYSGFDKTETTQLHLHLIRVINKWYGGSDEDSLVRFVLYADLYNAWHVSPKGVIYGYTHCLPSGHMLTTIANSMYNSVAFRYAYVCAHDSIGAIMHFDEHVRLNVYGDDNICAVSDAKLGVFNQRTIPGCMEKVGLVYTTEDKGEAKSDARSLEEVSFLKRSFVWDKEYCRYIAPLEQGVIEEMPYWTKKGPEAFEITMVNVNTALREASLHTPEYFEEFLGKILGPCRDAEIRIISTNQRALRYNVLDEGILYH